MKNDKDIQWITECAQRIIVGSNEYIGVLDEEANVINHAYKLGRFFDWIKLVNIEQAQTIKLSTSASYTVEPLTLEDREKIDCLLNKMIHAKKYFREYTENNIFTRLNGE